MTTTVTLLLSMFLTTSAPFADAQPTEYQSPPYLQRLFPDKGHVVGGTTITIYGGGFKRGGTLRVRFSAVSGEIDEVPATYVDAGRITCISPARLTTHDAHVAVSNNGVAFSSFPLVDFDEGTYLRFSYVSHVPKGTWVLDVAAGSFRGGTRVTIFDENHRSSTRHSDENFLPGAHLRCRFGNARNASGAYSYNVSVAEKTRAHPRFGVGYHRGYVIDALEDDASGTRSPYTVNYEGITLTLIRGRSYTFRLDSSTAGYPFYFTDAEPSAWVEDAFVGEVIDDVSGSRSEGAGQNVTFTVPLNAPDTLYYACGAFRAMGGVVRVLHETLETGSFGSPNFSGPPSSHRNAVPAEWVSYNNIRCVTPPWDGETDDDRTHGGYQVTVFVTNDGVRYGAGFGDADSPRDASEALGSSPNRGGLGATFTYFDANPFIDVPKFVPAFTSADASLALSGGPRGASRESFGGSFNLTALSAAALSPRYFYHYAFEEAHSFSDVYDDYGRRREWRHAESVFAWEAHENLTTRVAALNDNSSNAPTDLSLRNDLMVSGTYSGGGFAWYEIVVDGFDVANGNATTVRWRKHRGGVNTTIPWVLTNVTVSKDDVATAPDFVEGVRLGDDGLTAGFAASGNDARRSVGDRWTFRVYGGVPGVYDMYTTHDEPRIRARGPMEGSTEVTLEGSGFFPGTDQLLCRFADANVSDPKSGNARESGVVMTVPARSPETDAAGFASSRGGAGSSSIYRKIRCVTERHAASDAGGSGSGEILNTLAPCVNKTVTVSHDGGRTWSASDLVFFLFCDVHVSVSGSDVVGTGVPGNPYKTLQRGIEAALGRPKFPERRRQRTFAQTASRATYGQGGFGGAAGAEAKGPSRHPGYGYVLNRDRLRLGGGTYAGNGNRGVHPLGKMLEVQAKRSQSVVIDCEGSGEGAVLSSGDRHADRGSGSVSLSGIQEVNCNDRPSA